MILDSDELSIPWNPRPTASKRRLLRPCGEIDAYLSEGRSEGDTGGDPEVIPCLPDLLAPWNSESALRDSSSKSRGSSR
jgi:hypothetical protein